LQGEAIAHCRHLAPTAWASEAGGRASTSSRARVRCVWVCKVPERIARAIRAAPHPPSRRSHRRSLLQRSAVRRGCGRASHAPHARLETARPGVREHACGKTRLAACVCLGPRNARAAAHTHAVCIVRSCLSHCDPSCPTPTAHNLCALAALAHARFPGVA
jgi:hypothetical protein